MMKLKHMVAVAVAGLALSSTAFALPTYFFNADAPKGGTKAGEILTVAGEYDSGNETLSFSSTIAEANGKLANGFWLVLSDGPNPKGDVNEYAIFYADGLTGNLTAYVYSGKNNDKSYLTEDFIGFYENALTVENHDDNSRTFSITDLDVSGVNSFNEHDEWDGAAFGEKVGIWFHPAVLTGTEYGDEGELLSFANGNRSSYFDVANFEASVPEPAGIALLGSALVLLAVSRRRRKA